MKPALVLTVFLTGCVGAVPTDDMTPDGGSASGGSNTPPPPFSEAAHPAPPQMTKNAGNVLAAPKIVPIFFSSTDPMKAQLEQFTSQLAGSAYWHAIASEYGVGNLMVGASIVTADTPPATDSALDTWLAGHFNGQNGWPTAPDAQTIYTVFLPTDQYTATGLGAACVAFGAYHYETAQTATNAPILYALMPRCNKGTSVELEDLTVAASHEWIEAATDPHVVTGDAFHSVDDAHYVWEYVPGSEVGDMCEYVDTAIQPLVGSFYVQRAWSNAAATAGHDPCVPSTGPYLGVAPVLTDVQSITTYEGGTMSTRGLKLAVGASTTIEVDLFSDQQVEPWTVGANDAAVIAGNAAELSFSWDKKTGGNGDKLHLTITRLKAGSATTGGSELVVGALGPDGKAQSLWWGFVAN